MPYYDYKCKCGHAKEYYTGMMEYQKCPICETEMKRVPHAQYGINMGACGAYGYYDDNLETYVSTNKQRKEVMRQKGVNEKGATPKSGDAWV